MRKLPPVCLLLVFVISACSQKKTQAPPAPVEMTAEQTMAAKAPAQAAWPTYHGAASLDGVAPVPLPQTLALAWRFNVGAAVLNTPVADAAHIAFADDNGTVHVLDHAGQQLWSKSFTETNGADVATLAPLILSEGTLIACTTTGVIYAMDVHSGAERWHNDTGMPILGSPNVAVAAGGAKQLYVIDQSAGALQCFNFANGKPVWKSKGVARCDGSPAANAKYVVYGSCASALHVFSTANGEMAREISLDSESQVAGGVVLLGNLVFSASRSGAFIHANVETGKLIWTNTDCTGEAFSTPAVDDGHVVFGANDGTLYALNRRDGKAIWKQQLKDTPTSPVIAGDRIVVGIAGELHVLGLADGKSLWSYPVSDEISSPALVGPMIVVGSTDGTVLAFGAAAGA